VKTAIILHGKAGKDEFYSPEYPSCSNSHWLPWLQKRLIVGGIAAHTPEIPNAWDPDYDIWCKEFERYDITPDTLLVGHSLGGTFLVRWLSEHPDVIVGKVVLVAPSTGVDCDWDRHGFFDFTIDPNLVSRTAGVTIFGSDNDAPGIIESIKQLRSVLTDVKYQELKGLGHFTFKRMQTEAFPALLDELLS
jgi:predicted alpha/beta hydrolase family esterase